MATAVEYPPPQIKPVVSIRDVTHHYGKVLSLDRISVEIPTGIMVGIIGPDGAGKSTLLGLMAGSKKMQEGQIDVLGGDMRQLRHRRAVCPKIAYMPQGLGKNLYGDPASFGRIDSRRKPARLAAGDHILPAVKALR